MTPLGSNTHILRYSFVWQSITACFTVCDCASVCCTSVSCIVSMGLASDALCTQPSMTELHSCGTQHCLAHLSDLLCGGASASRDWLLSSRNSSHCRIQSTHWRVVQHVKCVFGHAVQTAMLYNAWCVSCESCQKCVKCNSTSSTHMSQTCWFVSCSYQKMCGSCCKDALHTEALLCRTTCLPLPAEQHPMRV